MSGVQDKPHGSADSWYAYWRMEAGVTTRHLSEDEDVGLSKVFLNKLEHGLKRPSPETAEKLARALSKYVDVDLTPDDLFPKNGMKSPRQAARLYYELVKKREREEEERRSRKKKRRTRKERSR